MICRNCGAGLEAGRIDTSLDVVTCSHCGSLHSISGRKDLEHATDSDSTPAEKLKRAEIALPKKFTVVRTPGGMQVSWSVGGIFQGVVIAIIAGAFAYAALSSGMLVLLIASAGLFYFSAAQALNKHRIRVDGARLEVTQGPLPWKGSKKLNASDVVQLYTTEHESRTQSDKDGHRKVIVHKYYRLSANTRQGKRVKILNALRDPRQALWLEQEIERLLGIADKPVTGEHLL